MKTHELEQGKNIIGIQYRVGHKAHLGLPQKGEQKQNGLTCDQAVFFVQRRGLEPPSQLRRQHLKLVCLPVPPPLRR